MRIAARTESRLDQFTAALPRQFLSECLEDKVPKSAKTAAAFLMAVEGTLGCDSAWMSRSLSNKTEIAANTYSIGQNTTL